MPDEASYRKAKKEWIAMECKDLELLDENIQNSTFPSGTATACITGQRQTLFLTDRNANFTDIEFSSHGPRSSVRKSKGRNYRQHEQRYFWRLYKDLKKLITS